MAGSGWWRRPGGGSPLTSHHQRNPAVIKLPRPAGRRRARARPELRRGYFDVDISKPHGARDVIGPEVQLD
jgi:hypothetical protein